MPRPGPHSLPTTEGPAISRPLAAGKRMRFRCAPFSSHHFPIAPRASRGKFASSARPSCRLLAQPWVLVGRSRAQGCVASPPPARAGEGGWGGHLRLAASRPFPLRSGSGRHSSILTWLLPVLIARVPVFASYFHAIKVAMELSTFLIASLL